MAKIQLPKKFVSQYPHKFAQGKKNYLQPPGNIPIAEITQGLLTLAGRLNVKTAKVIINSSLQRR